MQAVKWIEMVQLGPAATERSSAYDEEKVRVYIFWRVILGHMLKF